MPFPYASTTSPSNSIFSSLPLIWCSLLASGVGARTCAPRQIVLYALTTRTFWACGPLSPWPRSNSTLAPSASVLNPSPWSALKWTNTSLPPSLGLMNPKPFASLNHFTVPVVTLKNTSSCQLENGQRRRTGAHPVLARYPPKLAGLGRPPRRESTSVSPPAALDDCSRRAHWTSAQAAVSASESPGEGSEVARAHDRGERRTLHRVVRRVDRRPDPADLPSITQARLGGSPPRGGGRRSGLGSR